MSSYADRFLLQIRNVVRAAHALASQEGAVVSYSQTHWTAVLQTLEGHTNDVNSVAFSPDGKQVVSGLADRERGAGPTI
jgi:WD40 repeat protein